VVAGTLAYSSPCHADNDNTGGYHDMHFNLPDNNTITLQRGFNGIGVLIINGSRANTYSLHKNVRTGNRFTGTGTVRFNDHQISTGSSDVKGVASKARRKIPRPGIIDIYSYPGKDAAGYLDIVKNRPVFQFVTGTGPSRGRFVTDASSPGTTQGRSAVLRI
jgi:hypothetical protein